MRTVSDDANGHGGAERKGVTSTAQAQPIVSRFRRTVGDVPERQGATATRNDQGERRGPPQARTQCPSLAERAAFEKVGLSAPLTNAKGILPNRNGYNRDK